MAPHYRKWYHNNTCPPIGAALWRLPPLIAATAKKRPRPKGQQDLARVRAPFSTPVHGHGARVLPSNGTLPGGAPAGWAVRGAHRAWPGAGGQRCPLSQLPQRSDRQRRIYSAGLPFKSCIESNSRPAYMIRGDKANRSTGNWFDLS